MSTDAPHPSVREADRLIYAGLLGLGAACVIQLIDKSDLDLAQEIGIYAFALSIPFLAAGLVADYARQAGTRVPPLYDLVGVLGALGAVVGFGSLFFHFGIGHGVMFAVCVVIAIIVIRRLD